MTSHLKIIPCKKFKKKGKNVPCGIIFMPNIKKIISWHKISWDRQTDGNRGKKK